MALYVQKYGGTSVGSPERIRAVAERIARFRNNGDDVVVVVSAMSGETNRLTALAQEMAATPSTKELDVLLASGEQVTIALLSMAIQELGLDARSFLGSQIRIITSANHSKARIEHIEQDALRAALAAGQVPVVAGFQGVTADGEVTTFGRGGSDTTAVALAAALGVTECQICLLYTSPSPRDKRQSRMPSSA